ncbi:hypothetical protein RUND412_001377 [Rhizina undulata]
MVVVGQYGAPSKRILLVVVEEIPTFDDGIASSSGFGALVILELTTGTLLAFRPYAEFFANKKPIGLSFTSPKLSLTVFVLKQPLYELCRPNTEMPKFLVVTDLGTEETKNARSLRKDSLCPNLNIQVPGKVPSPGTTVPSSIEDVPYGEAAELEFTI